MAILEQKKVCSKHANQNGPKRKLFLNPLIRREFFTLEEHRRREAILLSRASAKPPTTSTLSLADTETTVLNRVMSSERRSTSVRAMLNRPFKKVCNLLLHLDQDKDYDLISETILHFSLRIYGLPECRQGDLPLSVYFFIEDTFGIQSKIVLCVGLQEEGETNVIGVVFETINMKYKILRKNWLLEGSEVRLTNNEDLDWITDSWCNN